MDNLLTVLEDLMGFSFESNPALFCVLVPIAFKSVDVIARMVLHVLFPGREV